MYIGKDLYKLLLLSSYHFTFKIATNVEAQDDKKESTRKNGKKICLN